MQGAVTKGFEVAEPGSHSHGEWRGRTKKKKGPASQTQHASSKASVLQRAEVAAALGAQWQEAGAIPN